MAISSIGAGSGLPLDTLLLDLRKAENKPLALIERRAASVQQKLGGYDAIKQALQSLQTSARALAEPATFSAVTVNTQGDALSAKASTAAMPGRYSIAIQQLATNQTLTSTGQASRDTRLASGTTSIVITRANGASETLTLAPSESSLEGIVQAINRSPQTGLHATLINDGTTLPHRLLLTAAESGAANEIQSIAVAAIDERSDATALQALLGFEKNAAGSLAETAAQQARLTINGIMIESNSNTIQDAIEGVTLTLARTTPTDAPLRLSLSRDDGNVASAINAFVGAYNTLQGVLSTLTAYHPDKHQGSPLTGDAIARRIPESLRQTLNAPARDTLPLSLPELGLSTQPDGTLSINTAKLDKALKAKRPEVQALLAGENGLGARIAGVADAYIKPDGALERATTAMTGTLKTLDRQFELASSRIDARMETYRKQFVQLDAMVAKMNSLSNYLTQQLALLGRPGKEK